MLKNKVARELLGCIYAAILMGGLSACGCARQDTPQATTTVIEVDKEHTTVPEDITPTDVVSREQPTTTEVSETEAKPTGEVEGEGGGNEYKNDSEAVVYEFDVLISDAEYYYKNEPIPLDDLIETIKEIEGDKIVIISDNKASLNAYESLTKKLTELEIPYEDKQE